VNAPALQGVTSALDTAGSPCSSPSLPGLSTSQPNHALEAKPRASEKLPSPQSTQNRRQSRLGLRIPSGARPPTPMHPTAQYEVGSADIACTPASPEGYAQCIFKQYPDDELPSPGQPPAGLSTAQLIRWQAENESARQSPKSPKSPMSPLRSPQSPLSPASDLAPTNPLAVNYTKNAQLPWRPYTPLPGLEASQSKEQDQTA